jgi:hypothetical protein
MGSLQLLVELVNKLQGFYLAKSPVTYLLWAFCPEFDGSPRSILSFCVYHFLS